MNNSIPIQRSDDALKQLEQDYNVRRPMLSHVAAAVKSEVEELLNDEGYQVRLSQSVLTGRQFVELVRNRSTEYPLVEETSQVHVRVVSSGSDDIEAIRETIVEKLYDSIEEGWKEDRSQLTLKFLIPPQARPNGFSDRDDLPSQMQLSILASQSQPRMTTDGEPIPSLALIMQGGGIKGLSYVGALDLLRDEYDFSWFVGTSAGAITAILLAAGYDVEELQEILENKDFNDFFDASWYQYPTNLLFKWGIHPAKAFTDWLDGLLAAKLDKRTEVTLGEIQAKTGNRITVYACRQRKRALVFDSDQKPSTLAAHAARCSMSIPFIFTPAKHDGKLVFDGGVQNNFPILKLREDHGEVPFISLFLGAENFEPIKETSLLQVLKDIVLGQGDDEVVERFRDQTVVIDPRPIGTLDFKLADEEKLFLLTTGRVGAHKHYVRNGIETADDGLSEQVETRTGLKSTIQELRRSRRLKIYFWRTVWVAIALAVVTLFALAFNERTRKAKEKRIEENASTLEALLQHVISPPTLEKPATNQNEFLEAVREDLPDDLTVDQEQLLSAAEIFVSDSPNLVSLRKTIEGLKQSGDINVRFWAELFLGHINFVLQEDRAAIAAFKNAVEIRPKNPSALNGLGTVFYGARRFREGLDCFEKLRGVWTKGELTWFINQQNLGYGFQKIGNTSSAVEEFRRIINCKVQPRASNTSDSIKMFRADSMVQVARLMPKSKAQESIELTTNALSLYSSVVQIGTRAERIEAHSLLADLYRSLNSFDLAINECGNALRQLYEPNDAAQMTPLPDQLKAELEVELKFQIGQLLFLTNDLESAVIKLESLIDSNPADRLFVANCMKFVADALVELGRTEDAIKQMKLSSELFHELFVEERKDDYGKYYIYTLSRVADFQRDFRDTSGSLKAFKRAIASGLDQMKSFGKFHFKYDCHNGLGRTYLVRQEYDAAIIQFQLAFDSAETEAEKAEALINRSLARLYAGKDCREIIETLTEAIQRIKGVEATSLTLPENELAEAKAALLGSAYSTRGAANNKLGNVEAADNDYQKARIEYQVLLKKKASRKVDVIFFLINYSKFLSKNGMAERSSEIFTEAWEQFETLPYQHKFPEMKKSLEELKESNEHE